MFKRRKIEFRTPPKHHHSSRPAKNCHNAKNQLPREISCPFLALESAIIFGCDLDRSCQTGKIATFLMLLNGRGVYTDTNSHQMFAFSMEVACYTVPLPCKSLFFSKLFAVHWPMLPMCHRVPPRNKGGSACRKRKRKGDGLRRTRKVELETDIGGRKK